MLGRRLCGAILDIDVYVMAVRAHLYGEIFPIVFILGLPGCAFKKSKECVAEAVQY